jgi:hypothetical protein
MKYHSLDVSKIEGAAYFDHHLSENAFSAGMI